MKILQKYFSLEIGRSVLFVLIAFLALFAFFDMVGELKSVGHGGYKIQHAFLYVVMEMPGYVYELMPIAALIGTIWALSQFAARSEFTIMRASSMSTAMVGVILFKIGLVFAVITFVFGEFVVPVTSNMAERVRVTSQGGALAQEFRSGLWTKDVIRTNGQEGEVIGSRFVNVRELKSDGKLLNLKIYEIDRNFHLTALITAASAEYAGSNNWTLHDGTIAAFGASKLQGTAVSTDITTAISLSKFASKSLISEMTPEILSVGFTDPASMSAIALVNYTQYLSENKRDTIRYEIALWKKIVYPFAVFVMMALALPFAYLHFRSGGVSLKIFTGIMIGVSFQLINSLFSHLGLLNTWPPFATAILPSLLFLTVAVGALLWVERH
ncbi:Lipopolysaccharide export system permease protein LptG [compost metagenome]